MITFIFLFTTIILILVNLAFFYFKVRTQIENIQDINKIIEVEKILFGKEIFDNDLYTYTVKKIN